jgi:hypothetical protein
MLLAMFRPAKAAEVVITLTGTLSGGYDRFPMFNVGRKLAGAGGWDISGQPFTLFFFFDDTKGKKKQTACGSTIEGGNDDSPGSAILVINGVTHKFGNGRGTSGLSKNIAGAQCSVSYIFMGVDQATKFFDFASSVDVRLYPGKGSPSLSQNPDWRAPLSTENVDNQSSCFYISGEHGHEAKGCFNVQKLEISVAKASAGR